MIFDLSFAEILMVLPLIIFSLVIHEHAHARTAWAFGDPTAKEMGRMTFNPLAHLDPIGTLSMIFIGFGWAKPVPVNPLNLHPIRLGDIAVSLAGPASNLLVAVVSLLVFCGVDAAYGRGLIGLSVYNPLSDGLFYLAMINVVLCTFNLVPLYPLDGHHILGDLLPYSMGKAYMDWQLHYGRVLMIGLLVGPSVLARVTNNPDIPNPLHIFYDYASDAILAVMHMA